MAPRQKTLQAGCAFSLANLLPPHIMVRLFIWVAFFSFVACYDHPYFTVPEGGIICHHHDLSTPAGTVSVGCEQVCTAPSPIKVTPLIKKDCVTVAHGAVKYMDPAVNYTCELGACEGSTCKPFDLLIGCWKPLS
uniref:Evasin n=1 Tax=Rhipicephalus appendiculatus TaxID=34631 RepID=A0A131YHH1_RHIAP